jgi:hypothetical protein
MVLAITYQGRMTDECDCASAKQARGGHVVVRCGTPGCMEKWLSPLHRTDHLRELGHHRPGYR